MWVNCRKFVLHSFPQFVMAKFCSWAGMICLVAAIILSIETNIFTGLSMIPGALVLIVLAKHLDNQEEIIEAVKSSACPQLYYINRFAPSLVKDVVLTDSPEYADANITISSPHLTKDGSFSIRGSVSRKKGMVTRYADFVVEFAPGECYHRQLDWLLTRFEWV